MLDMYIVFGFGLYRLKFIHALVLGMAVPRACAFGFKLLGVERVGGQGTDFRILGLGFEGFRFERGSIPLQALLKRNLKFSWTMDCHFHISPKAPCTLLVDT